MYSYADRLRAVELYLRLGNMQSSTTPGMCLPIAFTQSTAD